MADEMTTPPPGSLMGTEVAAAQSAGSSFVHFYQLHYDVLAQLRTELVTHQHSHG